MSAAAALGISGSYSEEAAIGLLGNGCRIIGCTDFEAVFSEVLTGKARYAVVPVENSITGEIEQARTLLAASGLDVFDRIEIPVRHILAGTPDATLERVRAILSHPEALRQCTDFFSRNPTLVSIEAEDTASGVRRIVNEGKPELAAIGSRRAAEAHGAKILLEGIADDPDNRTTFVLAGHGARRRKI